MQLKLLLMNADDYFHKSQTQLANLAPACQVKLRLEAAMSTTGFAKFSLVVVLVGAPMTEQQLGGHISTVTCQNSAKV